jgi:UDP-2,3-diacylglucosamine pyrophosphatase LpxH
MKRRVHYRTIFISDLHLGFRGSQAAELLSFLKSVECDYLYLVGDIFDLWAMKQKIFWSPESTAVLHRILKMIKNGTKVIYIPGNHDEVIRNFVPLIFNAELTVMDDAVHTTLKGVRLKVIHGDIFDFVAHWLSVLGSHVYDCLIRLNGFLHWCRKHLGYKKYWSLSNYLKKKTKTALSAIDNFETACLIHAKKENCQGVICGHIHTAKMYTTSEGMIYANCGDWVESLTALVETVDGDLELIHWHDLTHIGVEDDAGQG